MKSHVAASCAQTDDTKKTDFQIPLALVAPRVAELPCRGLKPLPQFEPQAPFPRMVPGSC